MHLRSIARTVVTTAAALAVAAGLFTCPASHAAASTVPAADITYAPCVWFATGHAIPAYTHLDVCVSATGQRVPVASVAALRPRFVAPGEVEWARGLTAHDADRLATALARARHDAWCGDIPNGGDDFNPSRHECVDIGYVSTSDHRSTVYTLAAGANS